MTGFAIRPMVKSDEPFIFRAWLEGYWPHFPGRVVMSRGEFMERWHIIIERILADPKTRTVVAHVEGHPDMLLGFACGNDTCLHWAYVKQAFRQMGIASALLQSSPVSCEGNGHYISHWCASLPPLRHWHYAPELLNEYWICRIEEEKP